MKSFPLVKTASAALLLLASCMLTTLASAQTVEVYSTQLEGSNVVHISVRATDAYGYSETLGYYSDGQGGDRVVDDTARVDSRGVLLRSATVTNTQVYDTINSMYAHPLHGDYNNITNNCGTAVDSALDTAGATGAQGLFDYSTVAIVETGWNIVTSWVSSGISAIWNAFQEFFE